MGSILDLGVKIVMAIQGLGGWLDLPMKFFSFLGNEYFFMVLLPVLFWCVDSGLGLRVGFILLSGGCINDFLKLAFHGSRPYWYSLKVKGLASETSFGIPSGHSQSAVEVWGMLAAGVKRNWTWIVSGLLIFFIGFSRMYLGVHFPHDVLAGWLIGGLLLWLTLRFWDPVAAWLRKRTTLQQILIGLGFSILLLLPCLLARAWLVANWQIPVAWLQNAAAAIPNGTPPDPTSIEGTVSNAGTIFGLALGLALLARWGGFQNKGEWWKLVLRFLLGIIGILIVYSLKVIFPQGDTLLALTLRYLRYVCIGAWVTGGAPWLFVRLKLAKKVAEGS